MLLMLLLPYQDQQVKKNNQTGACAGCSTASFANICSSLMKLELSLHPEC